MYEHERILNELAQGLRPFPDGLAWFEALDEEKQSVVLRHLGHFCYQSHPTREEAVEAVRLSGLRPTHTPCVLILRGRADEQAGRVATLRPRHERIKAFRLLVRLLAVADARRRRFCGGRCSHAWHRLPDPTGEAEPTGEAAASRSPGDGA
ncbi:DUF5958 family protein [Streptomyces sp. NPDC002734]|uniref:DUF5958 family protein n=1 Tax=Streptomyces sp. NPDC002734 TaxID=3154426 RepID=UPI00331AF8E3